MRTAEAKINPKPPHEVLARKRSEHAAAYAAGRMPGRVDLTLSEALVLGLLRQGVKTYLTVLGHGSTEVGEVLRVYQDAGLVRVYGVRSEVEASHAASALRWVTGKKAAVLTSIGPGALQALAGSLVPALDGIGVWYLFGDETTEDGGFNMQQIPRHQQRLFLQQADLLIDGAEHGARGCILLLDNGRMGAITSLQHDQYGQGFATWSTVHVDYLVWAGVLPGLLALDGGHMPGRLAAALEQAGKHPGLSLIHVPVYFGPDPLGGMGVYGRWNVGPWCEDVQGLRHQIGL